MTYNYLSVHSGAAIDSAVARALKLPVPSSEIDGKILIATSSNFNADDFSSVFDDNIEEIKLTGYTSPNMITVQGYDTTPVSAVDTIPEGFRKVQAQIWNTVLSINNIVERQQEKGNIYIVNNSGYLDTTPLNSSIRQTIGASRVIDDGTGLKIITD